MIKVEKTTKTDLKAKGLCIFNDKVVDEGEVVDLIEMIKNTYGDSPFDLSVTRSVKEEIDELIDGE